MNLADGRLICDKCGATVDAPDKYIKGYWCGNCGYLHYSNHVYTKDIRTAGEFAEEIRFVLAEIHRIMQKPPVEQKVRVKLLCDLCDLFDWQQVLDEYCTISILKVLTALIEQVPASSRRAVGGDASREDYITFINYFDMTEMNLNVITAFINFCFGRNIESYDFRKIDFTLSEPELYLLSWYSNTMEDKSIYKRIGRSAKRKQGKYIRCGIFTGLILTIAFCLFAVSDIMVLVRSRENPSILPAVFLLAALLIADTVVAIIALEAISKKYKKSKNQIYDILDKR